MNNTDSITAINYDSIFVNPELQLLVNAIFTQEEKKKVAVFFENDLPRNDKFTVTRTFPFTLNELPKKINELKELHKLISLAPHLFQTQKVIYTGKLTKLKLLAQAADYFFRNAYHKKSIYLKHKFFSELDFSTAKPLEGILFQEYKLNTSRFFIELLKYFQANGGSVFVNKSFNKDEISAQKIKTTIPLIQESLFYCRLKSPIILQW